MSGEREAASRHFVNIELLRAKKVLAQLRTESQVQGTESQVQGTECQESTCATESQEQGTKSKVPRTWR